MLLYPKNIEDKLEVNSIKEILLGFCHTQTGRNKVLNLSPQSKFDKLQETLNQTSETLAILEEGQHPNAHFEEIGDLLKRLRTEGVFLEGENFLSLKIALQSIYEWTQFLKKHQTEYSSLVQLTYGFIANRELVDEIESKVDEKGEIRSNASPLLSELRGEIIKSEKKVRNSLQKILDKARSNKYSEEEMEITLREGRLVIPVKSEHKRHIPGLIHDESSTGQTVFMEPSAVLELNNRVKELKYEERREIRRILLSLADQIRETLPDLEKGVSFLGLMDFILAKAKFGRKFEGRIPKIRKNPFINLINGYHPLLKLKNEESKKVTVPLNLFMNNKDQRIVIISGPNAGGKSVALKTIGLLQFMLQCGLPITAGEESEMGIFNEIFLDIGDSQSLENDLSTYSSRLKAMSYFIEFAGKRSLLLFDEFGTGTEPQFGGAIAEVILEEIHEKRAFSLITTHYGNIKQLAEKHEGIVNGAMQYDTQKLRPLFTLELGKPGSSFAFEIAQNIGLPKRIISNARDKVGTSHVDYDRLLTELESDRKRFKEKGKELKRQEQDLSQLQKDYEAIKNMLEDDRKKIIRDAKREARDILNNANKTIEKTVREIKESKADKRKTKEAREKVANLSDSLNDEPIRKSPTKNNVFQIGDRVKVGAQDGTGEIIELGKKEARVRFGLLTSYVNFDRLEKVGKVSGERVKQKRVGGINFESKLTDFSDELDVRGKRAEEVIPLLDQFLNDAIITGRNEVKILHGKGHGVLREVVRSHLQRDQHVEKFNDEHVERGGSGVTIATLK